MLQSFSTRELAHYIGDPDMAEQQLPLKQLPPNQIEPSAQLLSALPTIAAVTVKIPPFWPVDPQLWFAQVEAQFNTPNVTNERTKLSCRLSHPGILH